LVSASFVRADTEKERVTREKSGKQTFKFYYQVFSGFELSVKEIDEEKLNTFFEIKIGSTVIKSKATCPGRFPNWNEIDSKDVSLSKEISFESDIMVSIISKGAESTFGKEEDKIIGQFSIDINSI
jgi:hypothetical protein